MQNVYKTRISLWKWVFQDPTGSVSETRERQSSYAWCGAVSTTVCCSLEKLSCA